jgi:3-methyladenine DNA glycosylase AlkD
MPRAVNTCPAFVRAVASALAPLTDAEAAVGMHAYMRGRFHYLGIPTPPRRAAVKLLVRSFTPADAPTLRAAAAALWQMREREYQYIAVDLLARHASALTLTDLPWLLELAQQKSWWDSVDAIVKVVGKIVRASGVRGKREMDRAIRADNLWVRRIAMLHQLGWRAGTDTVRLFRYADRLAPETEFFIRKAVGWALRDYAWHDWRAVEKYLAAAQDRLSPLTYREASKNIHKLARNSRAARS